MDQEMLRQHLEQAEEHVKAGENNIARQREVITTLEGDGHDTTTARAVLVQFEELQAMHIADRNRIRGELGDSGASQAQGSEGMADVMTCPICGLNTKRIDDTEPATYECSDHTYRVEGKVLEDDVLRGKGKMEWRDAYESAKRRAPSGELPIVTSDDFDKASPPPAV
jgi:hypothetical protein